jgi:cupin superfamily acireductone dioxygenase involved in methionine salvage
VSTTIEKIKTTKTYKHFLKLGFGITFLAAPSLLGGIAMHSGHIANLFGYGFLSSLVLGPSVMISGGIYNAYKKSKIMKLANQYVNFSQSHLLDDTKKWAREPKNTEAIIKHMLINLYLQKNNLTYVREEDSLESQFRSITKDYSYQLVSLIKMAKDGPAFNQLFKTIYEQDFKNEGLLGYCISHNLNFLTHIILNVQGKNFELTEADKNSIKKVHQTFYFSYVDEIDGTKISHSSTAIEKIKETLDLLYSPRYYPKLSKDMREFIIENTEPSYLESKKSDIATLEAKINTLNETNLIEDLNIKKSQEKEEVFISQSKTETSSLSHIIHSLVDNQNSQLTQEQKEKLNQILTKSEELSIHIDKLGLEQSIELKNYLELAIPKYLQVFAKNQHDDTYSKQFSATISLFDNYLDECFNHVEKHTANEFLVSDTYLQNKLKQYRKDDNTQTSKKLKMNQ